MEYRTMCSKKTVFSFICLLAIMAAACGCSKDTVKEEPLTPEGQKRIKAVFIGNSITEIWSWDHPEFFTRNGYVNKGIGGQVTGQFIERFGTDVIDLNPYCVVIMGGINDIAHNAGFAPTLEGIRDNFATMVTMAKEHGIVPIIVSTPPAQNVTWNGRVADATEKVVELNKLLQAYAKENDIHYVDVHSQLRDENNKLRAEYCRGNTDSVHLCADGYTVIEKIIKHSLDDVLLSIKSKKLRFCYTDYSNPNLKN